MPDTAALLAAYDAQMRPAETTNLPPGVRAEHDGPIVRVVGMRRRGFITGAPDLAMAGAELDALIARQVAFFAARGEAVEWKTRGHDLPAELPDRLVAAGFVAEPPETVLVASTADLATAPPEVDGVTLREVTADADMHRIAEMSAQVWHDETREGEAADLITRVRQGRDRVVVVVAEADGLVVSAARLEIEPGTEFGGLWGGATLPAWRGRGIYRALVAHRAAIAAARGVRYLQVDATQDSRPILERLGFVAVTTTTPYGWAPGSTMRG